MSLKPFHAYSAGNSLVEFSMLGLVSSSSYAMACRFQTKYDYKYNYDSNDSDSIGGSTYDGKPSLSKYKSISVLVVYYFTWSGALDSSGVLRSYSIISLD